MSRAACRSLFLVAIAALSVAAAPATPVPAAIPGPDPVVVARFVENARDNINLGTYPDGRPLERETPEQRARPIVPKETSERIWQRGFLSGNIEGCNGDWKTLSFDPMMAALRARGDLDDKQLGFAALLHDAAREQGNKGYEENCTPEYKQNIMASLKVLRGVKF